MRPIALNLPKSSEGEIDESLTTDDDHPLLPASAPRMLPAFELWITLPFTVAESRSARDLVALHEFRAGRGRAVEYFFNEPLARPHLVVAHAYVVHDRVANHMCVRIGLADVPPKVANHDGQLASESNRWQTRGITIGPPPRCRDQILLSSAHAAWSSGR